MQHYYYCNDGSTVFGPVTKDELIGLRASGEASNSTQICEEGTQEWVPLESLLASTTATVEPRRVTPTTSPPNGTTTQKRTVGLAVASLLLGILIYVAAGQLAHLVGTNLADLLAAIFFAVPAVICGHLARFKINKNRTQLKGGGVAIAGLILGYIAVLAMAGQILIISRFENLQNEAKSKACIMNMGYIDAAKMQWSIDKNKKNGDLVSKDDLAEYLGGRVTPKCPQGGSYTYNPIGVDPECSVHGKLSDAVK